MQKKILFLGREWHSLWKNEKKILFTILISMFFSFCAILILASVMSKEMESFFHESKIKCLYTIQTNGYKDLEQILYGDGLPKMKEIFFNSAVAMGAYDQKKEEKIPEEEIWYFDEELSILNTETPIVLSGNFFTQAQLKTGDMVVIMTEKAKQALYPSKEIGDDVLLWGNPFRLIGVCQGDENKCYFPMNCVKNIKNTENHGIEITGVYVTFEKPLTEEQKEHLCSKLSFYKDGTEKLESDFEKMISDYYMIAVKYIFLIGVVLTFCMVNLIVLVRYFIGKHLYDYVVYKVCGIQNYLFAILIYGQIFILTFFAFFMAMLGWQRIYPYLSSLDIAGNISNMHIFFIAIGILLIECCVVSGNVWKLIKYSPLNRTLWRNV